MIAASEARLRRTCREDPDAADAVIWFARTMHEVLHARLISSPVLAGSRSLIEYVVGAMAHLAGEQVRALFLTAGNHVISDEVVALGCVTEVRLRDRHVIARALELGAAALVLVHNHPSGNPMPSDDDLVGTRTLADLCRRLDIRLHDHLVVASGGICSLRAMGAIS